MTKIVFIRHAESEYNKDGIWAGRVDCSLTEKGIEAAKELGKTIKNNFDAIYCSPLKRTKQTLEAIFPDAKPIYDNRIIEISIGEWENKKKRLEFLLAKNVDAVILVGSGFVDSDDSMNQYIRDAADKVPVMLINASMSYPNIYSVACDDRKAVYEATEWLYRSGSENVLFIYNQTSYSGIRKLAGFHEAARTYGKDWNRYSVFCPNELVNVHNIADFVDRVYQRDLPFDAVVTADDNLAAGVLKFARRREIKVPEELRVIGFNNSYITEYCQPELTSIDNRLEELCKISVDAIADLLEHHIIPHNEMLSARLVEREST